MRFPGGFEPTDAFVHIPAEGADDTDVIVVPHVSVGHNIEARFFLLANYSRNSVLISLLVLNLFESDTYVASEQLMFVPVWPWKRPHHGSWQNGIGDFDWHGGMLSSAKSKAKERIWHSSRSWTASSLTSLNGQKPRKATSWPSGFPVTRTRSK